MNAKVETPAKTTDDDNHGPMVIAVGQEDDCVCLAFGAPVGFLGFSPQEAVKLAESILGHARAIARRKGETLVEGLGASITAPSASRGGH